MTFKIHSKKEANYLQTDYFSHCPRLSSFTTWLPSRATAWLSTAMPGACCKVQPLCQTLSGRGQCLC